jgi:hypothetical protein
MALQQFFKWLVLDEGDRSPMERVRQPKTPQKLIPVILRRPPGERWCGVRAAPSE